MIIRKAHKLKPEDKVGVVSPSEPIVFRNKFRSSIKELEKMGLEVILGEHVFKEYRGYLAGTVEERINDLNKMIKDRQIKAIFTSLGGFASNQLLPLINYSTLKKNPKIIIGYSDISVLLNAIYAKTKLITFHGPTLEYGIPQWKKFTKDYFYKTLFTSKPIGMIKSFKTLKPGKASGRLIGGNLSVLRTLWGTKFSPNWRGSIFFWEDENITFEDLEHFLAHLKLVGALGKMRGMVIGKLKNIYKFKSKRRKANSVEQIVLEATKDYDFPIIMNVDFGHFPKQITIPIGAKATIDTFKNLFSIDESGVRD